MWLSETEDDEEEGVRDDIQSVKNSMLQNLWKRWAKVEW